MGSEVAQVSKPQLKGLLQSQIKKHLVVGVVLAITGGVAFKFLVCDARKQRYADFYKNYDAEKEFQRMKAAGLFQSVAQVEAWEERQKLMENRKSVAIAL